MPSRVLIPTQILAKLWGLSHLRTWLSSRWLHAPALDSPPLLGQRMALGLRGEQAAARYLRKKKYRIIEQRLRSPLGEIDIIAVDGRTMVFVEVKTRRSSTFGRPSQSLRTTQQARLSRSASAYLKSHGLLQNASRFDVVEILWPREQRLPNIRHIPNAFPAVGQGQFYR
ncbi:MAG: YraN family protein [Pirellulales bacterium]